MTWQQFRRRQRAIQSALQYCREHPTATPTPHAISDAQGIFADSDELLAALQYRWTQALIGRIELACTEVADQPGADRVDTVVAAWNRTATDNPTLRAVLDGNAESAGPRFAAALRREGRVLALASGLAQAGDTQEAIERLGVALRALFALPSHSAGRDIFGPVDAGA